MGEWGQVAVSAIHIFYKVATVNSAALVGNNLIYYFREPKLKDHRLKQAYGRI